MNFLKITNNYSCILEMRVIPSYITKDQVHIMKGELPGTYFFEAMRFSL